jgi:hypothetical protein
MPRGGACPRPYSIQILNPKRQTPNNTEIQKSKVKNQNDNSKCKNRKSSNAKAQMTIEIQKLKCQNHPVLSFGIWPCDIV